MLYFVNVVATILETRETIPYSGTELVFTRLVDDSSSHAYIYAITFVLLLLFALGIVALVLMIKYKRTQERLFYEMQDVRNVAGIELVELQDTSSSSPLQKEEGGYPSSD